MAEHQDIIEQEVQKRLVNVVGIRVELRHSKHRESQEDEFHGICLEIHSKVISSFYQGTLVLLHEPCTPHHIPERAANTVVFKGILAFVNSYCYDGSYGSECLPNMHEALSST